MIFSFRAFILLIIIFFPSLLFSQSYKNGVGSWKTQQSSSFIENKGQIKDQHGNLRSDVKYIYSAPGFKAIFKEKSFSYELYILQADSSDINYNKKAVTFKFNEQQASKKINISRIDVSLPGAIDPVILAEGKSAGYDNYLAHTSNNSVQLFGYTKLIYQDIWPNIDIVFYAKNDGELKYDIVVRPGGRLKDIAFKYIGASGIQSKDGKLKIHTSVGYLLENIPVSYTKDDKQHVDISYSEVTENIIHFKGEYPISKTLIIDPVFKWSTYFGGDFSESGYSIVTDNAGNVYITGTTNSSNQVATTGAYQTSLGGIYDAYLLKLNSNGVRQWCTYLGGTEDDYGSTLVFDTAGYIYMAGTTKSSSGIATAGSHQQYIGKKFIVAHDAFLAKFDTSGKIQWSTYYGGNLSDYGWGVAVDKSGNVILCGGGASTTGIATTGSHQAAIAGNNDAFIVKFNNKGVRLWGTYYGGKSNGSNTGDDGVDYAVTDSSGNIYVTGSTGSASGIASSGTHQSTFSGRSDAFLAKFNANGVMQWGTYFGGTYNDNGTMLCMDDNENIYCAGSTNCKTNISTPGIHQDTIGSSPEVYDAFLAKFKNNGSLIWSTYYGGTLDEFGHGVAVNKAGNVFLSGETKSKTNIAVSGSHQDTLAGENDGFLAKFTSKGKRLWSTYYGGTKSEGIYDIALDTADNIYITGNTKSTGLATTGMHQTSLDGTDDVFIAKFISDADVSAISALVSKNGQCGIQKDTIKIRIKNNGDKILDSVKINYTTNGKNLRSLIYKRSLVPYDTSMYIALDTTTFPLGKTILKFWTSHPNGIADPNPRNDTVLYEVNVYPVPTASFFFLDSSICKNQSITIIDSSKISSGKISFYQWDFGDGTYSTKQKPDKIYAKPGTYKVSLIITSEHGCEAMATRYITIDPVPAVDFSFSNSCEGSLINFTNKSAISAGSVSNYIWKFGDSTSSSAENPAKKYFLAGTYMVTLVVISDKGCSDSLTKTITIYPKPVVDFTISNVCESLAVSINNNSTVSTGAIKSYFWKFGDGTFSTARVPLKIYNSPANYTVTLIVTTFNGCTDSSAQNVSIFPKPVSSFSADNVCFGSPAVFINTSSVLLDSILNFKWDFGDGTNSTDSLPVKTYINPGKYTVSLQVTSTAGCTNISQHDVTVFPIPVASFKSNDACLGDLTVFSNTSTINNGKISTYLWSFGDSSFSALQNPTHIFQKPGIYDVWLKVVSVNGCTDSIMGKVSVFTNPDASFDIIQVRNKEYRFVPKDTSLKFLWDLGDGTLSTLTKPQHTYSADGTYKVKLNVTNTYACADSSEQTINIITVGIKKTVTDDPNIIQIYPNPFREKAIIAYKLASAGNVNIALIDIHGKSIQLKSTSSETSGQHQFIFDANQYNLPAGIYLIKLESEGLIIYKRVIKIN